MKTRLRTGRCAKFSPITHVVCPNVEAVPPPKNT